VLFADEPTGNLDADTSGMVVKLLFDLNRVAGTTLLLVTHDLELAAEADRIIRLRGGRVESDRATTERPATRTSGAEPAADAAGAAVEDTRA